MRNFVLNFQVFYLAEKMLSILKKTKQTWMFQMPINIHKISKTFLKLNHVNKMPI